MGNNGKPLRNSPEGPGNVHVLPLLPSSISVIKEDSRESETSGEFRDSHSGSGNKLCDAEQITEFLWAHFPPTKNQGV